MIVVVALTNDRVVPMKVLWVSDTLLSSVHARFPSERTDISMYFDISSPEFQDCVKPQHLDSFELIFGALLLGLE